MREGVGKLTEGQRCPRHGEHGPSSWSGHIERLAGPGDQEGRRTWPGETKDAGMKTNLKGMTRYDFAGRRFLFTLIIKGGQGDKRFRFFQRLPKVRGRARPDRVGFRVYASGMDSIGSWRRGEK